MLSGPSKAGLMAALGVDELYEGSHVIRSPTRNQGMTFYQMAEEKQIWTDNDIKQLQNAYLNQKHKSYCNWRDNEFEKIVPRNMISYPKNNGYFELKVQADDSCNVTRRR